MKIRLENKLMKLHFQFILPSVTTTIVTKRNIDRQGYHTPTRHTYAVKERNKKQKVCELPSSE